MRGERDVTALIFLNIFPKVRTSQRRSTDTVCGSVQAVLQRAVLILENY